MKRISKNIYCGVFLDDAGKLRFNLNKDRLYRDIVLYNKDTSGVISGSIPIIYGYEYNPKFIDYTNTKLRQFRNSLKYPDILDDSLHQFVETAVLRIGNYYDLNKFTCTIRIKPRKSRSVLSLMDSYLSEYVSKDRVPLELIKSTVENVKFDTEKARKAMMEAGYSLRQISEDIEIALELFEVLKEQGKLFEMKKFSPRSLRKGFYDFLQFGSDEEKALFEQLQGAYVLIYDDLLTSGSTIEEADRYLKSINNRNRLVGFVLIKQ